MASDDTSLSSDSDSNSTAEFIRQYFNSSDNDSDADEFSGFTEEDILRPANIIREFDIEQSTKDRIFVADNSNGWRRIDETPFFAPFTGNPGLNVDIADDAEPIEYFKLLFDNQMWDTITDQTNLYAEQRATSNPNISQYSRMRQWRPVTVDEMKVFFAFIISMGITRKSDLADYWSKDEIIETPFFGKYMSRNCFFAILSNLHIVNNEHYHPPRGHAEHDALFKLRPFINMLLQKFGDIYDPDENLSLDEATCPFKGRVHFRVYNPQKPNKFGIKLYQICEAKSGYTISFDIYHGDTSCIMYADAVDLDPDSTTTTKIVVGLLARTGLLSKSHKIYMDNYYNSPELADALEFYNTYCCGTLRINRKGVPEAIKKVKKLKPGEVIFRRKGNQLILKYHDKRDVNMISTFHEAKLVLTDKVNREGTAIVKPAIILDYIKNMGGVDLSDQIVQYYDVLRKTVKWWLKLFLHLFNLLLVNAYILYQKKQPESKRLHVQFRKSIVHALLLESNAPRPANRGRRSTKEPADRLKGKHFPAYIPCKEGAKRKRPLRDCIVCNVSSKKRTSFKRKQTSFYCKKCDVALCVPTCFQVYHTYQNYKSALASSASEGSQSQSPTEDSDN